MTDVMVRMGELAASRSAGETLVTLGLGSCIGVALIDRRTGVAGLAHVVLPDSGGHTEVNRFKFADHAVPELVTKVVALGGRRSMLEAVIVGGASMFATVNSSMEIGQRNREAVRAQLAKARIKVVAEATGGNRGRTVRIDPRSGVVLVREAGGKDTQLHPKTRILQEV